MPNETLVVVDSCSPDQSYFSEIDADVILEGNVNYETGALWGAYEALPQEDFLYLIHDSCEILAPLNFCKDTPVSTLMTARAWSSSKPVHIYWALEHLRKSKYDFLGNRFEMIFGSMLFIERQLLDKIRAKDFHKVLPTDKVGSCAMERLWGIALAQEGHEIIPHIVDYKWTDPEPLITPYLKKTWVHRS